MRIRPMAKPLAIDFDDISCGEVFSTVNYPDVLLMRIESLADDSLGYVNAVDLSNGEVVYIAGDASVYRVSGSFHIEAPATT